jgi:hypothetical protein
MLATGLVLLAGLVFGTQVIAWWRTDQHPPDAADHIAAVLGDSSPFGSGWMQFGESTLAVQCNSFDGNEQTALDGLRQRCRQAARGTPLFGQQPSVTEKQLLTKLETTSPIEQQPGKWRMFQLSEGVPMVAVVSENPFFGGSDAQVAAADSRVLSLGLAVRRSGQQLASHPRWTLMVCADGAPMTAGEQLPEPAPPPGSQRILAVRDDDGNQLCSWNGTADSVQWQVALDGWHASHGWKPASEWSQLGQNWHRRYEHPTTRFADVQFSETVAGSLIGFWTSAEGPTPSQKH